LGANLGDVQAGRGDSGDRFLLPIVQEDGPGRELLRWSNQTQVWQFAWVVHLPDTKRHSALICNYYIASKRKQTSESPGDNTGVITAVRIRNFQRHKSLDLELGPVATIIGDTDKGKSSILRALIWVLTNSPSGDKFIHHDTPGASVTVEMDKRTLKRARGKGANYYKLDNKKLEAFAQGVPTEVAEFVQMKEMNLQDQHDQAFWFHLSPPEVSRRLNAIIDLSLIDDALGYVATAVRKANAEVSFTEERLEEAKAKLAELSYAKEFVQAVDALVQKDEELSALSEKIARLSAVTDELEVQRQLIKSKIELPDFSVIDEMLNRYSKCRTEINYLSIALEDVLTKLRAMAQATTDYNELAAELAAMGDVCPTCGKLL